jgi:hypothetical protein
MPERKGQAMLLELVKLPSLAWREDKIDADTFGFLGFFKN